MLTCIAVSGPQKLAHRNFWTTPHILCLILTLYKLYFIRSSPCSPLIESNLRFSEMTCLNPQTILCFLISQRKTQVWSFSSRPPSTIFPRFFPVMSRFHVVLSVGQDLLLILIWCSGETVVFIEALTVMPPWRELHSKSSQCSFFKFIFISWKLKLELLIFFLGKLCNSFMHASKTTNFGSHELICLIGGYINTHITGTSLTLNMQTSTLFFLKFLLMRNCHQLEET